MSYEKRTEWAYWYKNVKDKPVLRFAPVTKKQVRFMRDCHEFDG